MKITLFNVSGRLSSDGSRLISSLLKRAGHRVRCIFMARPEPLTYALHELDLLEGLLKDTDLVMVAVYSSYAVRAAQVTEYVHRKYPGMKVIWGGPHCISAIGLSLVYADGVCFSEGDTAVVELVRRMEEGTEYWKTPNMAFTMNGEQIRNPILPQFSDLDSLPYYDYDLNDHYLLDGALFQMSKEILKQRLAGYPYYIPILWYLTSRGCPHRCTYCNNCRYVSMFGANTMRFLSVERVVRELESLLDRFDFFRLIGFGDDDFFMRSQAEIEQFAEIYKERIGLPFGVSLSARTYSKEKLEALLRAGLRAVQMGVQSASQRVLDEVYERKISVSRAKSVVSAIAPYQRTHTLDFFLDFIIDNPYETRDDIIKTYFFLTDLPSQVAINIFFLAFFPGTILYERAIRDGIIEPFSEKGFRFYTRSRLRYQTNYETFLILLLRYLRRNYKWSRYAPKFLLRMLGMRAARIVASFVPGTVYASLSKHFQ
jgi:anaerobic magnesium-protoporphyrin IX monomethyl ester cyclase